MQAKKLIFNKKGNVCIYIIDFKNVFIMFYGRFKLLFCEKDKMKNFYDDNMIFAQRIYEIVELLGNPNTVAKKAGVTASSVFRWLRGESDPSRTNLIRLADAANVNIAWLATGEGQKFKDKEQLDTKDTTDRHLAVNEAGKLVNIKDFVFIPEYDMKIGENYGYMTNDDDPVLTLAFRREWVTDYLHANPLDLSVMTVRGDSMADILLDGDKLLVNHAKNKPATGLYVLKIGDELIVKRTQLLPDNKLSVKSQNQAYDPFIIDLKSDLENKIEIIGRIEWFCRQI
ncbi:XRE family transcriptional regulator [Snodgrassella alvi]|uniref:XRE family transcriptional regulator n=1 Tax=Snodgrassella alvi TaxID=1196083 RepID=UPI003517AB71